MRTTNRAAATLVSLVVVPLAVAAWVAAWSFGYFASIVSVPVVLLALLLHRWVAHGPITRADAVSIGLVSLVAILLGVAASFLWQVAVAVGAATGDAPLDALADPAFGELLALTATGSTGRVILAALIALGLGALTFARFVWPRRRH